MSDQDPYTQDEQANQGVALHECAMCDNSYDATLMHCDSCGEANLQHPDDPIDTGMDAGEADQAERDEIYHEPHELMRFFEYKHLPNNIAAVMAPISEVAKVYDKHLDSSAEKTAGLRKLLEAQDCLMRASLWNPLTGST